MQPKKFLRGLAGSGVRLDEIPVLRKFSKQLRVLYIVRYG